MLNPCPCMSLQRGAMILALIDAIFSGILLAIYIIALVGICLIKPGDKDFREISQSDKNVAIVFCIFLIIVGICKLLLALYLRKSARNYDYHGCKKWLVIAIVLFVIAVVSLAVNLAATPTATALIADIVGKIYTLYVMFVVFSLMKEIDNGGVSEYPNTTGFTGA